MKDKHHEILCQDVDNLVDDHYQLSLRRDVKTPKREQKLEILLHTALILNEMIREHCKEQVEHGKRT